MGTSGEGDLVEWALKFYLCCETCGFGRILELKSERDRLSADHVISHRHVVSLGEIHE